MISGNNFPRWKFVAENPYRASMGLLSSVPAHVHDQHVLSLERLDLARAAAPLAHEQLLVGSDVVAVEVAHQLVLRAELTVAVHPAAVRLDEVWLVLDEAGGGRGHGGRGGRGGVAAVGEGGELRGAARGPAARRHGLKEQDGESCRDAVSLCSTVPCFCPCSP